MTRGNACEICGNPSELIVEFTYNNHVIPMKMCCKCFMKLMGPEGAK